MTKHNDIGGRDFDAATRRALLKQNVVIIGITALPDMSSPMPFANAIRGYQLDADGQHRVLAYFQVKVLAGTASERETSLAASGR